MAERMVWILVYSIFVDRIALDGKTPVNPKSIMQIVSLMCTKNQEMHVCLMTQT